MSDAASRYAVHGSAQTPAMRELVDAIAAACERAGFVPADGGTPPDLVLNVVDPESPRPYRRKSRGTFVATLHERPDAAEDMLRVNYPMLVRSLANVVLGYVPGRGVWFTTLERGLYDVPAAQGVEALAEEVVARLTPLARARLVIENVFVPDLEPELWDGDEITAELRVAGQRLDALDLLPAPFPVEELLDERDLRHVMRLYGVGGLSYGNLSMRKDERRFWMSASGVDKSDLRVPNRDILLVSDYDALGGKMVLSVAPGIEPRRVSVDAIEHWMIYQAHPEVGAILHVHAWVEGISSTQVNYPCGSEELARSVADLVDEAPDPNHAIIGLRNHGITVTGATLTEILDRIEPHVLRQVPMA